MKPNLSKLDRTRCPECHASTHTITIHQPALFIGCGAGATERTTIRFCPQCRYSIVAERTEVRP